jgi:hypothetical protein
MCARQALVLAYVVRMHVVAVALSKRFTPQCPLSPQPLSVGGDVVARIATKCSTIHGGEDQSVSHHLAAEPLN